ncbi:MAG: biotin--acetyl-CoA-carboxylase ligase [Bryobacterales bacterium]|nr:biotin--acetyl-CoA-carboxylase ligase [Bryobacterales bacterium]
MKDATALAAQGAPHGTAVVAESQSAGIGRHGHTWHSDDLGGLYLSIILRIPGAAPSVTLALGLAVQEAVDEVAGVASDLRWPNDVMISERKVAGILVQMADDALIAGIGVNANQLTFPPELRGTATSLRLETGRTFDMETLLQRVLTLSLHYTQLSRAAILRRFEECSSYARGKSVEVESMTGVTAGLDADGFLLVRTPNGIRTITAGGVRPVF